MQVEQRAPKYLPTELDIEVLRHGGEMLGLRERSKPGSESGSPEFARLHDRLFLKDNSECQSYFNFWITY